MPQGDLPGWNEVFADDFNEPSLAADPLWRPYWGAPGGTDNAWFDPSHDVIANGMLQLEAYRDPVDDLLGAPANSYVSGGVSSDPAFAQTYGKYEVRFRMDAGAGISGILLLWPTAGGWPPEIDFSEDMGSADKSTTYATLHYGSSNTQIEKSLAVDLTQWNTLGVEWTAGNLVFTINGQDWATISGSEVPDVPMALDMQDEANNCGGNWPCPDATTPAAVDMDIDWVVAYAPAG